MMKTEHLLLKAQRIISELKGLKEFEIKNLKGWIDEDKEADSLNRTVTKMHSVAQIELNKFNELEKLIDKSIRKELKK